MLAIPSVLLIIAIIIIFTISFDLLPIFFTRAEKIAIILGACFLYWMITSYVALIIGNIIPVEVIIYSQLFVSLLLLFYKYKKDIFEIRKYNRSKWNGFIEHLRNRNLRIYLPTVATMLFFICLLAVLFITFQPIVPLEPEFTWNNPNVGPKDVQEIRQFEYINLVNPSQIIGFVALFVLFILALIREKRIEYLAIVYFTFAIFLVIGPILFLGRPWGIDSYSVGTFVKMYENGNYTINEVYFAGYLDTLISRFVHSIIDANVLETVAVIIPLLHCQVFLLLWILFSSGKLYLKKNRFLLILVSFTPSLLQYCRIGSPLIIGLCFMLLTIWFIEKPRFDRNERSESIGNMWWPAVIFSALTAVHQVTALALVIYLMLRPLASLLGNTVADKRSFPTLVCVYATLEMSQFFEWRVTPMLNQIGLGGPLFSPIVNISIGQQNLVFRPIYGTAIIGGALFFYILVQGLQKRTRNSEQSAKAIMLYRFLTISGLVVGITLVSGMLIDPALIAFIEIIVAAPIELVTFYSVYILLAVYIPISLIKTKPNRGWFVLLYVTAHIISVLPEILFDFVGGGVAIRLVITIPVILGYINSQNTADLDLTTKTGIFLTIVLSTVILSSIAGSLIVHFVF